MSDNAIAGIIVMSATLILTLVIIYVIAKVGWGELSKMYRTDQPPGGQSLGVVSLKVGGFNYANAFRLYYTDQNIYLQPVVVMNWFCKPACIPYTDIQAGKAGRYMQSFDVGKESKVELKIVKKDCSGGSATKG